MPKHHHDKHQTWTERTQHQDFTPSAEVPGVPKQSPQHHESLGVAGHIVHMAGVFVPVLAGELVQDATKYKKVVRLASIGTALAYEGLWTWKQHQREQEREAKLAECRSRE